MKRLRYETALRHLHQPMVSMVVNTDFELKKDDVIKIRGKEYTVKAAILADNQRIHLGDEVCVVADLPKPKKPKK